MTGTPQLEDEVRIVWKFEDLSQFDYVRESTRRVGTRQRPVTAPAGELVGYAQLAETAERSGRAGVFFRRVFWLKPHDRHFEPGGVYANSNPSEAVDPRTVEPGRPGQQTDRVTSVARGAE